MLDQIVRGGSVVRPDGVERLDIGIEDGRIVQLAREILGPAREELSAAGLHVFPGVIDAHVHFNEPGHADWEGLASGSRAFAAGGGTLFIDMPLNSVPCTLTPRDVAEKVQLAQSNSVTDFALWGGLTPDNLDQLDGLAGAGAIGFKAFMSSSGLPEFGRADLDTLEAGMQRAAALGLPVAVHAEDDALTARLTAEAQAAGRTGWRDYLASRPVRAELNAVQAALDLARATGCALHIVHVSSGAGVALAAQARAAGVNVSIETCPHYLSFTDEDLEQLGAVLKCAPPLRDAATQADLWARVLDGTVDTVGSDHSPSPPELKLGRDFFRLWGGIAGVQSTLAALLTGGAARGLPLPAVARLLAANPAQRFRLAGRGQIEEGFAADLALVDLAGHFTLHAAELRQRHKQSPYVGQTFRGVVKQVLVRGQTVFDGRQFHPLGPAQWVRPG